ncbi:MAG: wax ester/triacylglycerol synthase family O-acyltransferase [Halioglobus sp.]
MQQLSPMDATFLYLENETTHAHGTLVWLYDANDCPADTISRRALLDHMRARLNVSPIFTRKVLRLPYDFDYPYWVDDPGFELLYHVREAAIGENGSWSDFCQLVAETHSQPLDQNHPLWEMTLVKGLDNIPGLPDKCFAILGKFHHVAIDGATGMQIIEGIHDLPAQKSPKALQATREARSPSLGESLYRAAIRNIGALDSGLKLLGLGNVSAESGEANEAEIAPAPALDLEQDPSGIPQTLFNQGVSNESSWDSRGFSLASIKSLRALADGATVNDVLLTIVAGGLRHYLADLDALPQQAMKAGCPVNIRTESEAGAGGNKISAIIISMHTNIEDPIERLQAITRSSTTAKNKASARGSRKILDITSVVPAQAQALLGHVAGKVTGVLNRAVAFNGSVSNLPGPQQELRILGGKLQSIGAAMPVMNGYGLFIGLTTCAGELRMSMTSCANIVPDPQKLGDCMDLSFRELNHSLAAKARATSSKKKTSNGTTKRKSARQKKATVKPPGKQK